MTRLPLDLARTRVTVTGGAGFLGRHLVEELVARGAADVFVPRSAEYDLRDRAAVRAMLDAAKPDLLIHAAAVVGGIGANEAAGATFLHDNAVMGLEVMEQARLAGVGRIVVVGTVCAYPRDAPIPLREATIFQGYPEATNAPYGLAKRLLLAFGQALRTQHGADVVHVLPANLYGPGDDFDPATSHVVPALVRRFVEAADAGEPEVVVWGDGSPSRDFLHVRDGARGVVDAALTYDDAAPLNLGTGVETTIRELASLVSEATDFRGRVGWDRARPGGQPRRCLAVDRARAAIGFAPTVALKNGLAETVGWFRAHRSG